MGICWTKQQIESERVILKLCCGCEEERFLIKRQDGSINVVKNLKKKCKKNSKTI
jgi:hypothetical protein